MLKFFDQNKTHFDSVRKIWSGREIRPFYDRNCSFGLIAFEQMRRDPNHVCQISDSENTRLTNEEVRIQAIRIARAFEKFGIEQSDIIGVTGRNTTYVFGVILACLFSGSAYHAINPLYDKKTSKHLFEITEPKIIFCDGQDLEKIRFAASEFRTKIFTLSNHVEGVPSVLDLLKPTGDEHMYQPAELKNGTDQNMAILCSSGTTGTPKCVTVSHLHHAFDASSYLTKDDIQYVTSTMDWLSAFFSITSTIVYGAARIISDKPATPEYFLEIVQKYKVTYTIQLSLSMAALVKCREATPEKLESILYYFYGGAKTVLATQHAVQKLLRNGIILNVYGFTEFNGAASRHCDFPKKPNSSGLLLPGVKMRIIDESGKNLGHNEVGEILCHGSRRWSGYYKNLEATRLMYDDEGWFRSGDLGYFDDDNYLYIVDRKKELLKYKGIQYFPTPVEEVIARLPDVKEVCVVGIESELYGELAGAAVVKVDGSSLTEEDIVRYVREEESESIYLQLNAGCKFFDAIPKAPNGKVDRKSTKAKFLEM